MEDDGSRQGHEKEIYEAGKLHADCLRSNEITFHSSKSPP